MVWSFDAILILGVQSLDATKKGLDATKTFKFWNRYLYTGKIIKVNVIQTIYRCVVLDANV